MYVSIYTCLYICVLSLVLYARYICVPILLYICPHTAIHAAAYCYICVRMILYMRPHSAKYASSYYCACPHTAICVSSYYFYARMLQGLSIAD